VAVGTAEVILVRSNPLDLVAIVRLSRAKYQKMIQDLLRATGHNVVAIPLAAGAPRHAACRTSMSRGESGRRVKRNTWIAGNLSWPAATVTLAICFEQYAASTCSTVTHLDHEDAGMTLNLEVS